jgi:glycine/D-amino acid oxidase-like deaminating enzyme
MIANECEVISNSLWTATSRPLPSWSPLAGEAETEVAVIGGGFTGLSAALHLAEQGIAVTLLEAETPGWGASGRNGGQVNPGLKEDPDGIEARFGEEMGRRMIALSGGAPEFTFKLIERLDIACAPVRKGWIQPVHTESAEARVRARAEQWSRRGEPVRMLSREDTAYLLGTDAYRCAMLDERGGNLHPLNYALGLAEAAAKAGARIHGHSRVTKMEQAGGEHILHTPSGRLRARKVLIGTNGYSGPEAPSLARSVVPIRSIQVATDILPEELQRKILPEGHSASDSRRLLLYFRKDPEGRFVMGGRGAYSARGTQIQMQALHDISQRLYPDLEGVEWRYAWGGFVAMTQDHYPHLSKVAPGAMAALGYNGRGVAMATALGKVLADWASGTPEEELPYPVQAPRPIPLHFLRKPAVSAVVAWSRVRDRLER